ncbi:MAG: fused MFS/spermidine synthase [Hyphomicrobiales bacterium]|nr:fused MFS/spermidine synthase [Hyphomicrobiales bacterium]
MHSRELNVTEVVHGSSGQLILPVYVFALFLSAFLAFSIQPMAAKCVVPHLGGAAAVWNTVMVFFQGTLLAGYTYCHLVTRLLAKKQQVFLHAVIFVLALLFVPFDLLSGVQTDQATLVTETPVLWLLGTLATTVGLPFLFVAATAPLLQQWFSQTGHKHAADPYFLYAASNLGSLLGLLGYPLVIEVMLNLNAQAVAWAWLFLGLGVTVIVCGLAGRTSTEPAAPETVSRTKAADRRLWRGRFLWLVYAATPCAYMLGVTYYITTDIAAVPLLWVIPFSLYLLTFVISFSRKPLIPHALAAQALPFLITALIALAIFKVLHLPLLCVHLLTFFCAALVCHGELARRRPEVSRLTEFYFLISLGGFLGGVVMALVAPSVFNDVFEYPLAIIAACALIPARGVLIKKMDWVVALVLAGVIWGAPNVAKHLSGSAEGLVLSCSVLVSSVIVFARKERPLGFALCVAVMLFSIMLSPKMGSVEDRLRSFFGVYKIAASDAGDYRLLYHGTTLHGAQRLDPSRRTEPLTYYSAGSPVQHALSASAQLHPNSTIGVVGLGVGSLACYRETGQTWKFYEIDPLVIEIATNRNLFSYLSECAPDAGIAVGDARLSLQTEPDGLFDLLILDAFSSDAIPMHLLTREAFQMYGRKLRENGVALIHISNRYLDLERALGPIASDLGFDAVLASNNDVSADDIARSKTSWIAFSRDGAALRAVMQNAEFRPLRSAAGGPLWTDNHTELLSVLR